MDGDVGQVAKDDVELFLLLLVLIEPLESIVCNYLVILVAFSLGILFVSKIDQSVSSFPNMNHTRIIQENMIGYKKIQTILTTLFWASLNPGPDTETFPEEGFTGYLTNILFGIYQIFVIIMLLNLLIAMMNSTIQKIQDKRSLYWKFERTSTMMDFINEYYVVPPPFLILHVTLYLVFLFLFGLVYGVWLLYKKISKENKDNVSVIKDEAEHFQSTSRKRKCKMDPVENKKRKQHACLMKKLIDTYLENCPNLKSGSNIGERELKSTEDI